jgi:hypothetical protein
MATLEFFSSLPEKLPQSNVDVIVHLHPRISLLQDRPWSNILDLEFVLPSVHICAVNNRFYVVQLVKLGTTPDLDDPVLVKHSKRLRLRRRESART